MTAATEYTGDAEVDAKALLERAWNFGISVPAVPVDPIFIARQLGLDVLEVRLEDGVGGMLVNKPGEPPTIYLNASDGRNRQRFTCAHELGHWTKRLGDSSGDWAFVDRRDALAGRGSDPSEIYANGFGAALLMPPEIVDDLSATMSPEGLAAHFGVSSEAMGNRLRNRWAVRRPQ